MECRSYIQPQQNTIIVFLLLLFIAVNIFNTFRIRNIKDKSIKAKKAKAFLIDLIKSGFYATKNPLSQFHQSRCNTPPF